MSLPKFVVFKNTDNARYLRYIGDDGPIPELVRCSGDEVWSPYAKFEVVPSTCIKGLIHLKCCSNNKFLRIYSPTCWWIVAGAEEKDENPSQPTCTLFRPDFDPFVTGTVRLLHFWSGTFAYGYRRCDGDYTNCIYSGPNADLTVSAFTYVDWEHIVPPKPKNSNIWIGAWGGGCEGDEWSFEAEGEGGITKIIIYSEDVVDALSFVSQTADGPIESPRFGGDGGIKHEIVLDWPKEYLTSIKGTYDRVDCESQVVITSLEFKTNKGKWTPLFGKKRGTTFGLKMKRGAIVGFHGRSSCSYIEAIGIFIRHVDEKEPCLVQEIVE